MIPNIDIRNIKSLNYINKKLNISISNPIQSKINSYKKSIKNSYNRIIYKNYLQQLQKAQPN